MQREWYIVNFIVQSRYDAERIAKHGTAYEQMTGRSYIIDEPYIVISFTDVDSEDADIKVEGNCKAIYRAKFHDTDRTNEQFLGVTLVPITEKQATEIWEFFKQYKDTVNTTIVHCEAGISRSSGCAAALAKAIDESDMRFFASFCPNRLVYRSILNVAMADSDTKEV